MSLTGKTPSETYKDLLQLDNSNDGLSTSTKVVKDGEGTSSSLQISDDQTIIRPNTDNTADALAVQNVGGGDVLTVDTANRLVRLNSGQHVANTNYKMFTMNATSAYPNAADTWQALSSLGFSRYHVPFNNGVATQTPGATVTLTSNTQYALGAYWQVPVDITIQAVKLLFSADAATGDTVKFSVMSYDIDMSNTSTGGDLSNGVQLAYSPASIASDGYEQIYYQALTIDTADVSAGKVIVAFINSDGTNSDYSVQMTLTYYLK